MEWNRVMCDSAFLEALLACRPPRRAEALALCKSAANRCHVDSGVAAIARAGPAFTEALLWLLRHSGDHRRGLAALDIERCLEEPPPGVPFRREAARWAREGGYFAWVADYLRFLWWTASPDQVLSLLPPVQDNDARRLSGDATRTKSSSGQHSEHLLAALGAVPDGHWRPTGGKSRAPTTSERAQAAQIVLHSLRHVIEYDPDLGLGVLCNFGGIGADGGGVGGGLEVQGTGGGSSSSNSSNSSSSSSSSSTNSSRSSSSSAP